MSDGSSFQVCSIEEGRVMSQVACMAQSMVREAAAPVPPGETIKGQLRRAARALGYRDGDWRVRAAWYGEAGAWSAAAYIDLQGRYRAWRQKQEQRARQEAEVLSARLGALEASLAQIDPDFHGPSLDALRGAARALGGRAGEAGHVVGAVDQKELDR